LTLTGVTELGFPLFTVKLNVLPTGSTLPEQFTEQIAANAVMPTSVGT
jgi:hypothetical protein